MDFKECLGMRNTLPGTEFFSYSTKSHDSHEIGRRNVTIGKHVLSYQMHMPAM